MDQVVQTNAASAEESASAAEELNAQAEFLRGAIRELRVVLGSTAAGEVLAASRPAAVSGGAVAGDAHGRPRGRSERPVAAGGRG
jgi:methyl-accepting chemotaxis protein